MKRIVLATIAVTAASAAIALPTASAQDAGAAGCAAQHATGTICQGPDANASASRCEIRTWVGEASCQVRAADGSVNNYRASATAYAEETGGDDLRAQVRLVVRNAGGGVITQPEAEETTAKEDAQFYPVDVPSTEVFAFGFTSGSFGATITCEASGTHSVFAAPLSPFAVSPSTTVGGMAANNNKLSCVAS